MFLACLVLFNILSTKPC